MRRLALVLTLLAGCGWTTRQKAMATTATALLAIDWKQTYTITRRCTEGNPLLGNCGQNIPVEAYFSMVIITMLGGGPKSPAMPDLPED